MSGSDVASPAAVRRLVQLAAQREGRGDYVTAGAAAQGALALLNGLG